MEKLENKSNNKILKIFISKLNSECFQHLIWLIIIFISIGLFCLGTFYTDDFFKNIIDNKISIEKRHFFIVFMFVFAALGFIVFGILLTIETYIQYLGLDFKLCFKHNDNVIDIISIKSDNCECEILDKTKWLRILAILFVIPLFLHKNEWRNHTIVYFFLLTAIGVYICTYFNSFYQALEGKFKVVLKEATEKKVVLGILITAILLYIIYITHCSFIRYEKFHTYTWDMGIYINAFWNTFFNNSFMGSDILENGNYLGSHFKIIPLIIVGPFYYFFPTPKTFYVIQAIFVGLGAIPIYLIGYHLLKSRWIALIFCLCYFFNPALHSANLWDFHEISFLPFLLGMMIYFLLINKHFLFYFLLPILLLIREDMALVISTIVLFFIFYQKKYTVGAITIGVSALWFIICRSFLMPIFGDTGEGVNYGFGYRFSDLIPYGKSPIDLFLSLLINPVFTLKLMFSDLKIIYLFQMLLPFFFIPLLRLRYCYFYLYGFAITMLSSMDYMSKIAFQYPLYWILGIIIATMFVVKDIKDKKITILQKLNYKAAITTILFLSFILSYQYGLILNKEHFKSGWRSIPFNYTVEDKAKYKYLHKMLKRLIPKNAIISADEHIYPHVAGKRHTYFRKENKGYIDYAITRERKFKKDDYILLEKVYGIYTYKRIKKKEPLPNKKK